MERGQAPRRSDGPPGGGGPSGIEFCPRCGGSLRDPRSLLNEYWYAGDTAYLCWCRACRWSGEIVVARRVTATEPAG